MKRFILAAIVLLPFTAGAQYINNASIKLTPAPEGKETMLVFNAGNYGGLVSQVPQFNGDLSNYLATNMRPHKEFKPGKYEGTTVKVVFTVSTTGQVSDAYITRGLTPALNSEALRLVNNMPPWRPAMRGDLPITSDWDVEVPFK